MATGGELNRAEGSRANPLSDGRISGLGKIIYITENCGLLYSTNKQKIYFGERHFHPFVKGIFGTLERGSYLHFEAKQSKKGGTKLTYSATKVWRTDVEESFESTLSKKKHDGKAALEAINFLRSILDVQLSLTLSSIYPLLSEAPRNVQDMLSSKKEIKKLLKRFPSVFQYSATADAVSLVDETVHGAIDCVVDLFKDDSCLDLGLVFKGVSAAPREIRQLLGHNEVDFLKFLTQYHDVFQVSKGDKDGRFSVSLRLSSAADEATDSYDTQSVDSSCSQDTCSGSSGVRSLSSALSVLSLDALSKLHGSGTTSPSPDGPAKQRGIAKLLNALADKEPMSLGSLIGYIHSSPPDVRDAVGNKMDKFTEFVKNDNNFLLLEPQNLVFVRNSVEKKALEYLVSVATKYKTVKVTDLLDLPRSDSDRVPAEVAALFGKDMPEISVSVQKLLTRQELLPHCNLVLQNDLISIRPSSHQFDAKSIINDSSSTAVGGDKVPKAAYSVPSEGSSFPSACEGKAVEFLRSVVKRHKLLAVLNVKSHLGQASVEIRQLLGNEKLIRDFVKRHPSVFKSFVTEDVIQLVDDDVRDAVEFFSRILTLRGDLLISSLVGHQSSAPARIRLATGGNPVCVTEFLMRHFDVFHVYEGKNGLMVALVGQKSLQQFDLSSMKQKISASFQCPTSSDFAVVRPVAVDQKGVSRKADGETGTCSDDPELDFLVGLLKSRGVMCLQDIVRCVSDAPTQIQDDLGRGDDEVLSYIEENPAIFKVSQGGRCIELVSEDEGDAIEFFLDILNKRGATPVSKIHGHLSQAADSIRKVTGGSPESVASFLLSFPNVFRTFRDKDIEMIESLYEGKGDSGGSLPSSDVERSPKLRPSDSDDVTVNEAASRFDRIDFGSIVGLPQLRSNVAASETLLPEVISSFVGGATGVQESALHSGAQFSEDSGTKSNDACKSELTRIEGTCYGHSQKQISDTFVAFDKNDHRNDERTILASESGLSDNFQVELATETPPGGANVPSGAMLQSNDSQLELLSVINLVRSAKDEQNVVADLCYETFSSRGRRGGGGGSLGTAELLSICHLADPLDKKWQNTLGLKSLTEILEADGRFVFNKANNRVFLRKDVERMAVEFLQNCIRFNGPIELSKLKYCDYLKRAGAEVRTVLSRGESSSKFKRSMVNNLWRKYRDQLNQEDRYLVIPCDVETLAIAFLSKLIETLGPIPVDVLSQHLLHAPVEVSWFFEEKCCLDIKLYLSSLSLGRHFIVVEDMVDLVRSGNLDKNRLVVEQQAVSFLVDVIRTHGPILLSAKKVDFLRTAAPAVRQLLGNEWNTCFWKNKLLKKLCLKRDEVFTVGKKTIGLVGSAVEAASYDSSTSTFAGDGIWSSQSARDATFEFLLGLMSDGGGVLDLRLRELRKHALFAAPPQARILLGGELNSFQLKKNLVVAFCSSYPEVFTVNKKSVLFLNRASGSMKTPVVLGSPSRGLKPTNHGDDAFLGSNDVSSVPPVKGVAEVGEETTCDVRHVACSDIPTCAANQPEFSLNAANISTATVSVFNISNTSMAFNYGPSTQISPADSPSCQSQGIAAACLPAVTPVAKGSVSEDSVLTDQSSDENSNENLETSESRDFHCGDFCLSTDCDALLEKNISNTDSKHLRPDGLSTLSSVSRSSQDSTCAAHVTASRQKSSIPVNCGSVAMSSQVLNFGEEFDRPLGDLCQYIDLLHTDTLKVGSLATVDDDFGDVWHANDAEQRSVDVDEDAVVKGNGTVLSAEGTLLYIKCEDGRLISCSSENCSGRFSKCQNIGRHFAIGEKVDVISERLSKRVSVRRSSSGRTTRRSENQRGKETVSHLEAADEVCCSDARIKSGRGRVSVLSSDVIAVMMGSLEMAAFTGRHSCRLALNDAVSFSARRAQHFMAPWQLDDIRTDRRDDVDTGQGSSAELLHLISASTTNGDVIKVSERNSVDDGDVIASGSPY